MMKRDGNSFQEQVKCDTDLDGAAMASSSEGRALDLMVGLADILLSAALIEAKGHGKSIFVAKNSARLRLR